MKTQRKPIPDLLLFTPGAGLTSAQASKKELRIYALANLYKIPPQRASALQGAQPPYLIALIEA